VQALGAGDTLTDTFVVTSGDGSATQTVTVDDQRDQRHSDDRRTFVGSVTEDNLAVAIGTLTSTDTDTGESNTFTAAGGVRCQWLRHLRGGRGWPLDLHA